MRRIILAFLTILVSLSVSAQDMSYVHKGHVDAKAAGLKASVESQELSVVDHGSTADVALTGLQMFGFNNICFKGVITKEKDGTITGVKSGEFSGMPKARIISLDGTLTKDGTQFVMILRSMGTVKVDFRYDTSPRK